MVHIGEGAGDILMENSTVSISAWYLANNFVGGTSIGINNTLIYAHMETSTV